MNEVWIVDEDVDYNDRVVIGIFDSGEKAIQFKIDLDTERGYTQAYESLGDIIEITKHVVK